MHGTEKPLDFPQKPETQEIRRRKNRPGRRRTGLVRRAVFATAKGAWQASVSGNRPFGDEIDQKLVLAALHA
jgi:hypothetical protein